jgi:hypothetical protein
MKIQNVFTYLEGRQPNLRLYLYSPASQALAMAAEAFPIVAINSELDAAPLMKPVDLGALVVNMNAGVKKPTSPDHHQALLIGAPLAALITLGLSMMRRVFRRVG